MDPRLVTLPRPFVVAITGSGKGVGAAIAEAYAHAGASGILLSSRTLDALERVRAGIRTINPDCEVHCQVCDVTSEEDITNLARECKKRFGRLDAAIINAGVASKFVTDSAGDRHFPRGILEDTTADFFRVWNTNFNGAYLAARAFLPLLQETPNGAQAMVFISSIASQHNYTDLTSAAYNISKLAVNRLVEHIDSAHKGDGILAHALHPGCIQTNTNDYPSFWDDIFIDDMSLPGAFCVWLTRERREWLAGRYLSANWDVQELEKDKELIVKEDKFKSYLKA
ncbi:hypothetical protein BDV33DRAFT_233321 [Aspergillus novoparasiticus]|uniref:NAD(P)-binding protein n=1 Tax=Aspergillus novoparasiticus TaxID=986946 RepID=A0A5N6EHC3_9EURO|nr:hypothetical protein BDV33DRAFT_233321 [Aspergillus novoparasiticus]